MHTSADTIHTGVSGHPKSSFRVVAMKLPNGRNSVEGKTIHTLVGPEKVVSVDIWRERVLLKAEDGSRRIVELAQLRNEVARAAQSDGNENRNREQGRKR